MLETQLDLTQFEDVDWARLAFPQPDGYDTQVLARIAHSRWGWELWPIPEGAPTWLDGKVMIETDDRYPINNFPQSRPGRTGDYLVMQADDQRWKAAAELAATWPEQYEQFRRLVNGVRAWFVPNQGVGGGCSCGSMCGNPFLPGKDLDYALHWGRVWATCSSATGYLEGICHELAHWKGYALGVYIEDWEHLLFTNRPPSKEDIKNAPCLGGITPAVHREWVAKGLGFQPLRPQGLRPLGACFQEIWCCVHMIAYHLRIYPRVYDGTAPYSQQLEGWLEWAVNHVKRTWRGQKDMCEIAKLTEGPGEAFWKGYTDWTQALVDEACATYGIEDPNDFTATDYPRDD